METHPDIKKERLRDVAGRIRSLRKHGHLTQRELAGRLDLTQSLISTIESGNGSMNVEVLRKLSDEFDVSIEWLLFGHERFTKLSASEGFIPFLSTGQQEAYLQSFVDGESDFELNRFKIPGHQGSDYQIFEIASDKMMPSIADGDLLMCQLANSSEGYFPEGAMHVVVTSGAIKFGRLYYPNSGKARYTLKFDNPSFPDDKINRTSVKQLWKVKTRITADFVKSSFQYFNRIDQLETEIRDLGQKVAQLLDGN